MATTGESEPSGESDPTVRELAADLSGDLAAVADLRRGTRRMAWIYAAAGVLLLPWIAYLAVTLPKRDLDTHYNAAWVGFDVLLVVAITRTAYMAYRVDPRVQLAATATATLLIVDAWFDVTTAGGRSATLQALVLAVFIEIPAALFSIYLAHRVARQVFHLAHLERLSAARDEEGSLPSVHAPPEPARPSLVGRPTLRRLRPRPARAPRR